MTTTSIIGTNGLPAAYGGFETMVNHLVQYTEGVNFNVYCPKTEKNKKLKNYNGAKLIYIPFKANGAQSIIYDIFSMLHAWYTSDSMLILGTPGCLILPLKFFFPKIKIIVNFGGLEWKREKWGMVARKYLKFTEALSVRFADNIVADNMAFVKYIKEYYNKDATLIEYGSDHTSKENFENHHLYKYPFLNAPYFVSVSRAQEDNNLHLLLEAFSQTPEKQLVLISNWNVSDYGRKLKQEYENYKNLHLIGPIYNQKELDILRSNAEVYIHSHKYCGTAPSLVEAMFLQLPIISFKTDTNLFTTENKAMYFENSEDLISVLKSNSDESIKKNGIEMKEIANRRYTWKIITQKYKELY